MKLLIAGFGDLGQTLAQTCLTTAGWEQTAVLAIRRNPPNKVYASNISWIQADLSQPESLAALTDHVAEITHVVYCAAPSERLESAYRSTYVDGLRNLVQYLTAQKASPAQKSHHAPPQLLFVSSTAVYDNQTKGEFDETSPTKPRGFNGRILLEAETWLAQHWAGAIILRLSGIYGPNKTGLLTSIASGTATIPTNPDFIANRIHIEDAARAILHLLGSRQSGVFIGTDSHPIPLADLYRGLARMLGAPEPKSGSASPMMGKKRLSNQKLLSTGLKLKWPDSMLGYKALIAARGQPDATQSS
ncbi:sugar nucleotide-binding protein [Orrella daihaiensis]|uniref:Sugar nucleotide-binding protein n=1 Tax=Orrella daihaiensis TaxID=2782176 RepID=A0ABY4AHA9_9BURK|nr:sugar nucleotide-binding protein [Orrella daihaiensis]UOD49293.1 sugar nucleotide-binding protein [Orrella daihaiensis]